MDPGRRCSHEYETRPLLKMGLCSSFVHKCHFCVSFLIILMEREYVGATNSSVSKLKSSYNFSQNFLGLDKCNACIGTSACKKFFKEEMRVQNWLAPDLRLPAPDLQNYAGNQIDGGESWKPIEISWLFSESQHNLADKRICSTVRKKKSCNIERILRKTKRFQRWMAAKRLTPDLVQGLPVQFLRCPSQRLLDRIIRRYTEVFDAGSVYMTHLTDKDKLRLLFTLSVNAHPIVLQIFPAAEGWPFPKYLGSCGHLFVSTNTQSLITFNNSNPEIAADLAYQLLQTIHHLSNNDLNYFFYFTNMDADTFGTFSDGRLYIRDTSSLGIIDLLNGKLGKDNEETDIFSCLSSDCPPILSSCSNITERQNVVLVCRSLLPYLLSGKFPHSTQQQIDKLLVVCSDDLITDLEVRKVSKKLMNILKPWCTCDPRFAYRYPECKYSSR